MFSWIERRYLTLLALSALIQPAAADDFLDLSIDQLLDIEVYTSTQKLEKSSKTPANITVITAQQIREWGVHDIYEALRMVPGVNMYKGYFGYTMMNFRGVQQELYTNKVLMLVNGHPTYDSLFGDARPGYVPIEMIERIEVIRGPGSALYGTNAMAGVINVITKKSNESSGEVTVRVGSDGYHYTQGQYLSENMAFAISERDDDGYNYSGTLDESGNLVNQDAYHDLKNAFIDLYGEDWRVNLAFFDETMAKLGTTLSADQAGDHQNEGYYLDATKSFDMWGGQLKLWFRYDKLDTAFYSDTFFVTNEPTKHYTEVDRTSYEAQFQKSIDNGLRVVVGSSYEQNNSEEFIFTSEVDGSVSPISPYPGVEPEYDNLALYSQLTYDYNDKWSGVLGLRWEDNDDTGPSDLIPRLGIVHQYSNDTTIKALYGEAFRAPVFFEKYVNSPPALIGNKDLDRETIKTYELSVETKINERNSMTLTGYYLDLDDEIRRVTIAGTPTYQNTQGREMYGLELQWASKLNNKTKFKLFSSLKDGEEKESGEGVYFSKFDFTAVLEYMFLPDWRLTLINNYVSDNDYLLNDGESGEVDGYNLVDLHIGYKRLQYEVSVEMKNIFDQAYEYAEPVRRNVPSVPGGADRSLYLTLRYQL